MERFPWARRSFVSWAIFVLFAFNAQSSCGQQNEWAWMGGSSAVPASGGAAGVYGTLSVPAPQNAPGGRAFGSSWTDRSGNLWLFGGAGFDSAGELGLLNDLWEFNPSINQWAWMGGVSTLDFSLPAGGTAGVYGTLRTAAVGNVPGGREESLSWTDEQGNFWLFGGQGYDSTGTRGDLNDLWKFDLSTKLWAWMGGSKTADQPGVYGTLAVPNASNVPGSRNSPIGWVDDSGNFWLFGGYGFGAPGSPDPQGSLDDLWSFNPSTLEWEWRGGSSLSTGGASGVFGTLGVPSAQNFPGGEVGAVSWTENSHLFWFFGGELNNLWQFDVGNEEWTWMSGGGQTSSPASYGTLGVSASGNTPGGRYSGASWTDSGGNLWLFGGQGFDSTGTEGELNDLWQFDSSNKQWTWIGGSNVVPNDSACSGYCAQPGVYGTLGVFAPTNIPGGRSATVSWTDKSGNFWLFGGTRLDSSGNAGLLNDLWVFQPKIVSLLAATPTFSVTAGTYTSPQTVTVSDSTPNATIYYTTNGTTPTTSSTVYSGPITVSVSETIEAIAVANGYSPSQVASSVYIINLPPPASFTLAASPGTVSIGAGGSGTVTLTVTPQNAFNSAVTFSCSGLPSGVTCLFNPSIVTPSGGVSATTQLTLSASTSAALRRGPGSYLPLTALALVLCLMRSRWRRDLICVVLIAAGVVGLGFISGCGGGGAGGGGGAKPPVQATVTVIATSGSIQQTSSIALTVN